tara:strand:+ start:74 stop:520 length:447 start_codon:yes stop_codon:yes gene_type:complete
LRIKSYTIYILFLVCLISGGCTENETIGLVDSDFDVYDVDSNPLTIQISGRYSYKESGWTKRAIQYEKNGGQAMKLLSTLTSKVSKNYTASEIYNYNRTEIENLVKSKFETNFDQMDLKILDFNFVSVKMSDSLRNELIKRHIEKIKN